MTSYSVLADTGVNLHRPTEDVEAIQDGGVTVELNNHPRGDGDVVTRRGDCSAGPERRCIAAPPLGGRVCGGSGGSGFGGTASTAEARVRVLLDVAAPVEIESKV
jgi:hypothetical protein